MNKVSQMPSIDQYEAVVLSAYEKRELRSVATKSELAKFKAAARAMAIKNRCVHHQLMARFPVQAPNPSAERAGQRPLHALWPAPHGKR